MTAVGDQLAREAGPASRCNPISQTTRNTC